MTVIAWKDGIIAADRAVGVGELLLEVAKLRRVGNVVLAACGPADFGEAMIEWYERGCLREEFPQTQKQEDFAILVAASPAGVSLFYQTQHAVRRAADWSAVGSGAELAIGAMAAGASAVEAVQIAITYSRSCGFGVDHTAYR